MLVDETQEYAELEAWARTFAFKEYGVAVQALSIFRQKHPSIWNGDDKELEAEAQRIARKRLSAKVNRLTDA